MSVIEYTLSKIQNGWLVAAVEENPEDPQQIAKTVWFEQTLADAFQTLMPKPRTPPPVAAPTKPMKVTGKPVPYSPEDLEAL